MNTTEKNVYKSLLKLLVSGVHISPDDKKYFLELHLNKTF